MAFNPSKQGEPLSAPTNGRKNSTNDPGFENRQGYYPYDLSHTEVLSPLYGMVTPSMHMITYMGDHHVVRDETKSILNRINGNFLNTVNQYVDSFFVSNRTMFPNNWDKLIPNPNKGDDLPNSARPAVPFCAYINEFINSDRSCTVRVGFKDEVDNNIVSFYSNVMEISARLEDNFGYVLSFDDSVNLSFTLANLTFVASILSRGQLLDYLGVQFDFPKTGDYLSSFQYRIDDFFDKYWAFVENSGIKLADVELSTTSETITVLPNAGSRVVTMEQFRDRYMHTVESGKLLWPITTGYFYDGPADTFEKVPLYQLLDSMQNLLDAINAIFGDFTALPLEDVDRSAEFNSDGSCINLSKCLAYQLSIAQYYTNNTVDNIYTSDLFMQQLRGVMFPSIDGYTSEPTFDYNGVPTEYDYISYGGFYSSIFGTRVPGWYGRMVVLGSLLFTLRRSLRYGDKFTTGRTQMLAVVGQLSIPVETDEQSGAMSVNPINVTMEIVTQRFLNAANRVGNKPLEYYSSIMGVVPSDLPSIPRYVGHRKIEFENRVTTNTADEQGAQTTNLVGYSDDMAFDVFIDDYGILLSLNSYDCLPIYTSGIDSENFLSDRFEYFNPMMQNIGDEAIRLTELIGNPSLYDSNFAYVVRNSEYKYKLSKAHGALCYNMPGFLLKFPIDLFDTDRGYQERIDHIGPDFIRDKPAILDSVITHTTGISPGRYFHFIVSVHNSVKSARLIQKAPGILF